MIHSTGMDEQLWDAITAIAPDNAEFNAICVNKNVKCEPHIDKNNKGMSWILFLGEFEGGDLCFANNMRISRKYIWHEFDGTHLHWNEDHIGIKFSVILYTKIRNTKPIRQSASRTI